MTMKRESDNFRGEVKHEDNHSRVASFWVELLVENVLAKAADARRVQAFERRKIYHVIR